MRIDWTVHEHDTSLSTRMITSSTTVDDYRIVIAEAWPPDTASWGTVSVYGQLGNLRASKHISNAWMAVRVGYRIAAFLASMETTAAVAASWPHPDLPAPGPVCRVLVDPTGSPG